MLLDAYAMKKHAQKTHLLASKWGIGNQKQELWRSHSNFLKRIIDNVAYKAHFGEEEDNCKSENKAA